MSSWPDGINLRRFRNSCDYCTESKLKCNREKPSCCRCLNRQRTCVYSPIRRIRRPTKSAKAITKSPDSMHGQDEIYQSTTSSPVQTPSHSPLPPWSSSTRVSAPTSDQHGHVSSTTTSCTGSPDLTTLMRTDFNHDDMYLDDMYLDKINSLNFAVSDQERPDSHLDSSHVYRDPSPSLSSAEQVHFSLSREDLGAYTTTSITTSPEDRPGSPLFGLAQFKSIFDETSTTLEMHHMIASVLNNSPSPPDSSCDYMCRCSALINKLQSFVSHPSLSRHKCSISLVLLLSVEQAAFQAKETIFDCANCQFGSLYQMVSLCVVIDWLIEHLQSVFPTTVSSSGPHGDSGERENSHDREMLEGSRDPLLHDPQSILCVGSFPMEGRMRKSCVRELLKIRLSRLARVLEDMGHVVQIGSNGVMSKAVKTMADGIHCKIESLFGMVELWGD